jgi:cobalt-zinc-cadmium efflux system outer membrane protein
VIPFTVTAVVADEQSIPEVAPMPLDRELQLESGPLRSPVMAGRTLSLRDTFEKALANNREIISARTNLPVSRAAIQIASAIPNPHFTLQYGWGAQWRYIIAGQPQQFGWQFDFQTAGKRSKQIDLARANYGVAEIQLAQLTFDVHNRVRRAYAEQAAAEAYNDLIEAERKVAFQLADLAEKRYKGGRSAYTDLLQAQLGVLQLDAQRYQAQLRLQQATAALSLLVGELPQRQEIIDVDDNGLFRLSTSRTDLVPNPATNMPALQELIPFAYTHRPDLKAQVQQRYADRRAVLVAKALRIPDVFIDTGYQFTTFRKYQPYRLFNNSQGLPSPLGNVPGVYFNVSAETPIFYQHQGEVAQALATYKQDFDQINQVRAQIATDSVSAYEAVNGARANLFRFKNDLLPAANELVRVSFRSYQVGRSDLSNAIIARQQYQQILSSYFDAVVAYQNAWADLEKAVGVALNL